MYTIPFTDRPDYRPKCIPGNDTSDTPVSFDLLMASGPDQARVKSLLSATTGLTLALPQWTPDVQRNVVVALENGARLFAGTVAAIRNLTAPAKLCRRVGIKVDEKDADDKQIPIENGPQFALVATYMPLLALELGFEIQRFTTEAQIDPRFFGSPSGSRTNAATPSGAARSARRRSNARGTAASPDQTANRPPST